MKHLFYICLLISPIFGLAQEPLIYFDKTRCQKQAKVIIQTTLEPPYLLNAKELIPANTHPSAITLWKNTDQTVLKKQLNLNKEKQIHFTKFGNFLLLIFDTINPKWIEISIQENQIHITPYINCVLH